MYDGASPAGATEHKCNACHVSPTPSIYLRPLAMPDLSRLPALERTGATCCEASCLAPTLCRAVDIVTAVAGPGGGRFGDRTRDAGPWISPDSQLRKLGVRYLQVGGDTWNRCGHGWVNVDGNFDVGDGAKGENLIFRDDTDRLNMKHVVSGGTLCLLSLFSWFISCGARRRLP